jgi:hypothetical protein
MKHRVLLLSIAAVLAVSPVASAQIGWRSEIQQLLPQFGAENWIVIADASYPMLTGPGVKVVQTGDNDDPLSVLKATLEAISVMKHLRPVVYTDAELPLLTETDAAGVSAYREKLAAVLADALVKSQPRAVTLTALLEQAKTRQILVLKTPLPVPYAAVSLEMKTGYLTPEVEARLKAALSGKSVKTKAEKREKK